MKLGNRTKIAAYIALWSIAGVALLAIPALFAATTSTPIEHPLLKGPGALTPFTVTGNTTPSSATTTSGSTYDLKDFVIRLIIILIPAAALSGLIKNYTDKRMRNVWI